MGKGKYYQYYVEGADEEKLINVMKSQMCLICPGKVEKINVVQEELTRLRLMQLRKDTIVVLVFDTDAGNVDILRKNIQILNQCCQVKKVICIPQVENLEDELLRSCDIRQIRELTGSKSNGDKNKITLHTLYYSLPSPPSHRCNQHHHRQKFQTACQHIKHQNIFGQIREQAEVGRGTYHSQARSDIVNRSGYRREIRGKIKIIQTDAQEGYRINQHITHHKNID